MYLIDTNVISELRKLGSDRIDMHVDEWSRSVRESELYVSVITIYELQIGVLSLARRDRRQAEILRSWLDTVVQRGFATRTLPVTTEIAAAAAALSVPNRRPVSDALIAATALVHSMVVVTRNVADFAGTGAQLLDPWQA